MWDCLWRGTLEARVTIAADRAVRFHYYYWGKGREVYDLLGHGVTFARFVAIHRPVSYLIVRGAAAALKLNCAFILVPVLRNLLAWYTVRVFRLPNS